MELTFTTTNISHIEHIMKTTSSSWKGGAMRLYATNISHKLHFDFCCVTPFNIFPTNGILTSVVSHHLLWHVLSLFFFPYFQNRSPLKSKFPSLFFMRCKSRFSFSNWVMFAHKIEVLNYEGNVKFECWRYRVCRTGIFSSMLTQKFIPFGNRFVTATYEVSPYLQILYGHTFP